MDNCREPRLEGGLDNVFMLAIEFWSPLHGLSFCLLFGGMLTGATGVVRQESVVRVCGTGLGRGAVGVWHTNCC